MTTARSQHPPRASRPRPGPAANSATGRRPGEAPGHRPLITQVHAHLHG